MTDRPLDETVRALVLGDPLPEVISDDALTLVRRARLSGLLIAAIIHEGREVGDAERDVVNRDLAWRAAHPRHVAYVNELWTHLADVGAEPVLFKGLWNAAHLYEPRTARPSSDIDIFVGHWSSETRRRAMAMLGVPQRRADALEQLATEGRPLHEFTVSAAERPNVDVHMNPLGLIGPIDPDLIGRHLRTAEMAGTGRLMGPTPALGLLIALSNITRKGGLHLIGACDAVRFIRAEDFDWVEFEEVSAATGLGSFARQSLWALVDDLTADLDLPFPRPRRRAFWTARLGHVRPVRSGGTAANLWRGRELRPGHVGEFIRWYCPSPTQLRARTDRADGNAASILVERVQRFVAVRRDGGARS